jgi:hypothetical protein
LCAVDYPLQLPTSPLGDQGAAYRRRCRPARSAITVTGGNGAAWATRPTVVQARGGQKKVDFYLRLRAFGIFPPDALATIRAFGLAVGQLSIEKLVDRYRLRSTPIRDLIVDYLRERQPALDFASLDATSRTVAGLFWAKIETRAPGIDTLRLPPDITRQ